VQAMLADSPQAKTGTSLDGNAGALAIAVSSLACARAWWGWVWQRLRAYREVAPLAGVAYALWKRRASQAALRQRHFMQQCTVLLVDIEGLRKRTELVERVSTPTLFSRTLRSMMFENEQMVELVTAAARRATPESPLLELGPNGWLVMANINAHLMETLGAIGHTAAACGRSVEIVEFLFALVNDRTTASRRQLRVYLVQEQALRDLPSAGDLDLRRGSSKRAYAVLRAMASFYRPQAEEHGERHKVAGISTGLPSGMGRTWLVYPRVAGANLGTGQQPLAALSAL